MSTRNKVIAYLHGQTELKTSLEISSAVHIPRNIVCAMLGNFNGGTEHAPVPGFFKEKQSGKMKYGVSVHVRPAKPKAEYHFPLPEELWRGWVSPETGVVPSRLGVYSHVWVSEKEK